ncbi:hypothetical protein E4U41_002416, partial [Claviceps citrina]
MAYCEECRRGFGTAQSLQQHRDMSRKHKQNCGRCAKFFGSEEALLQHGRDSPNHNVCTVNGCGVDLETYAAWSRHGEVAHPRCVACDEVDDEDNDEVVFDSFTDMVHHLDEVHHSPSAARLVSSAAHVLFTFTPYVLCWGNEDRCICVGSKSRQGVPPRAVCPGCPSTFASEAGRLKHLESGSCASGVDKSMIALFMPDFAGAREFVVRHWFENEGPWYSQTMALKGSDIEKHNDAKSCWGKAYDVTDFLPEHPGGSKIILKYAGKDATEAFEPIHPPDTLDKYLDRSKHLGEVDMATVAAREARAPDAEEAARLERVEQKPALSQCYNLFDFEAVARRVMKKTAWGYYSSAADDEITMRENHAAFHRIWFRPRVLVDVSKIDLSTTMLGAPCSMPFYVTATALGKLGHPEGEVVLTRAARTHGVVQMIPTLASCSFDEIVDARRGDQVQWLQLYVNSDRDITRRMVQHAERRGCKGLFVTVDAPQLGRREKDMRSRFAAEDADEQDEQDEQDPDEQIGSSVQAGHQTDRSQGAARAISSFIDPSLRWEDVAWLRRITRMPIVLKGVQRVEDVLLAIEAGAHGV